jgi:hypothetical protein
LILYDLFSLFSKTSRSAVAHTLRLAPAVLKNRKTKTHLSVCPNQEVRTERRTNLTREEIRDKKLEKKEKKRN